MLLNIYGIIEQSIFVPAEQVTSCTFGGKNLDVLYITTARTGLDEANLAMQPLAGGLFGIQLDVMGVAAYEYQG
jgi:sugar lactone lactonase YvrE